MATFHLFPQLPPELSINIWELAASEPRYILACTQPNGPVRSTAPPTLMHVCRESRALMVKRHEQVFTEGEAVRYHWVDYDTDVFVVEAEDMVANAWANMGPRRDRQWALSKARYCRIEFIGPYLPPCYLVLASSFMLRGSVKASFPQAKSVELLLDEPLHERLRIFRHESWKVYHRVAVNLVHTGECIDSDNWARYHDWFYNHRLNEDAAVEERQLSPLDPEDRRYESEVCPSRFIEGWTFPPLPSHWEASSGGVDR